MTAFLSWPGVFVKCIIAGISMPPKPADEELLIDEETEDEAYVEYDIATYPSDYTLDVLQQMKARGDIVIPPYQRRYVWSINQASLLVESFLLGLPVPSLFLYITDDNKSEVVDGQQRLLSMVYYLEGYFGEPDSKGKRQIFRLQGLSERSPFRYKKFVDLEDKFQRKLRSSVLRAINIRQLNPTANSTSVFHIFERLNTGGTSLKPQEIRNAVFRGKIVQDLKSLNNNVEWRTILGLRIDDRYQRDIELILRLFSLYHRWNSYEKPMKEWLNKSMKANAKFDSLDATVFKARFPQAVKTIIEALGTKPFRPKRVINAAVLESVMVTVLESPNLSAARLKRGYEVLLADSSFEKMIRGATTDTNIVRTRLETARRILAQ